MIHFPCFFNKNKLRVLMYHKVTANGAVDYLTITLAQLEEQINYLLKQDYSVISIHQLIGYVSKQLPLPAKPVLLTFDDGYHNNLTILYPLLQKFNICATIFLIGQNTLHSTDNNTEREYLDVKDIASMDKSIVSFGLHSYMHGSYATLNPEQVAMDIDYCMIHFNKLGIDVQPCLAYPYGAFPKRNIKKRKNLEEILRRKNIQLAFRIGNRLNVLPLKNSYLIERIDVRGIESFSKFKRKLHYGSKWW